jgi:perosamine synthetase
MPPYKLLEEEYAKYTGSKYAITCNSGTSALHLALLALKIGKGDEVIVPDFTMAACGFAVSYTGATPIFVDCGDDFNVDVSKIEEKITKKTKAIMAVHIYGRLCDMDAITKLAKKHKFYVVEDACEAQGAIYQSKADITCYSFYLNKIIPAEEGGICTTDNLKLAERMNYFKNMAFTPEHDYVHKEIGYNYRMTNSQAKFVLGGLSIVNDIQMGRYRVEALYDKYMKEEFKLPKRKVVWVYDIKHPRKEELVKYLNGLGINARHSFKPLSIMPMWKQSVGKKARKFSKEILYLPVSPLMTEETVKDICSKIDSF